MAGAREHALVLSDHQADTKGWKVSCLETAVIDIVAKIQAQAHSLEGPVVEAAAEIKEIVARGIVIIAKSTRIPGVNKGDNLRFAGGRQQAVRWVDREYPHPVAGPAHDPEFALHSQPLEYAKFAATARMADAQVTRIFRVQAIADEYIAFASILMAGVLCQRQGRCNEQ